MFEPSIEANRDQSYQFLEDRKPLLPEIVAPPPHPIDPAGSGFSCLHEVKEMQADIKRKNKEDSKQRDCDKFMIDH